MTKGKCLIMKDSALKQRAFTANLTKKKKKSRPTLPGDKQNHNH